MVQSVGFSGNSTDRPRASTVEVLSVVGPIAGSGTLEAVKARHVEPVRVGLACQQLSGTFSLSLRALAPLQRPVIETELFGSSENLIAPDKSSWPKHCVPISYTMDVGIVRRVFGNSL